MKLKEFFGWVLLWVGLSGMLFSFGLWRLERAAPVPGIAVEDHHGDYAAQAKLCASMPTLPRKTKTPCRFVAQGYTVTGWEQMRCDAPEKGCGP